MNFQVASIVIGLLLVFSSGFMLGLLMAQEDKDAK